MKKVDLLYFDAGGGHRSAANALRDVIQEQERPWEIQLVHLQELLDSLDIFRKISGVRLEDCYNLLLRKGWTLGSPQLTRLMQFIMRLYHPAGLQLLQEFWKRDQPQLVVSLVPNLNRVAGESLRQILPGVPYVTILTDIADYPPHFWIEPQAQYFICGSDKAVEQARAIGHPPEKIFRTSGMILNPRFYAPMEIDRAAQRRRLGLDPDLPTALVLFGGHGSNTMIEIARKLDVQMIAICGKNNALRDELKAMPRSKPTFVEGFTREVPYYMRLADFFIGKPGPGSISEALAMKLPVIVERNAFTLPQERYNADWVVENQFGMVLPNFRGVDEAVAEMLKPENFDRFQANASAYCNRAVFEIPDILDEILVQSA